jgi:hypothetical protein
VSTRTDRITALAAMAAEGYPGLTVNLSFGIRSGAAGITCDATLPASGAECLLAPGTVRRLSTVDALALSDGAEDAFLDGRGKPSPPVQHQQFD